VNQDNCPNCGSINIEEEGDAGVDYYYTWLRCRDCGEVFDEDE
jgi:rubredoxin